MIHGYLFMLLLVLIAVLARTAPLEAGVHDHDDAVRDDPVRQLLG